MTEASLRSVLLVLTWVVVAVRIPALRSPSQRPVWITLLILGLGAGLQVPDIANGINKFSGIPRVSSLLAGLNAVAVVTAVLTFAVRMKVASDTGRRPWRRPRLAYAVVTAAIMATAFIIAVTTGVPSRDRFLPVPGTFTALTVYWVAYLSYNLIVSTWATVLFWRQLPKIKTWMLRIAVLLLALATSASVVYILTRIAAVSSTTPTFISVGVVMSSAFFFLVTLGSSVAAIEPAVHGVVHWWHLRALYPLWKRLCDAVPHIALSPPRPWAANLVDLRNIRFRLERRVIEIRDGLLVMREWITPEQLDQIRTTITQQGLTGDRAEAAVTAGWLTLALQVKNQGTERASEPLNLVRRGGDDFDSELLWLRQIAAAMHAPIVQNSAALVAGSVGSQRDEPEPAA